MQLLSAAKLSLLAMSRRVSSPADSPEPRLVIVAYHRVGSGTDAFIDVPLPLFREQLSYLADHFDIVSIDEAATALKAGEPRNLAVLTFDDGYYDFYRNALPELAARGLPATVYMPTFYTDSGSRFPWDARFASFKSVRPMRWEELETVARSERITIGSHTHTHRRLDCIGLNELEQELRTCATLLRAHTGSHPNHFACPFGTVSKHLAAVAGVYFRTVVTGGWRANCFASADLHLLRRIPAPPAQDIRLFAAAIDGAGWLLGTGSQLRAAVGRKRAALTWL